MSLLQKSTIKETLFRKETYNFKEPTNRSHPISFPVRTKKLCSFVKAPYFDLEIQMMTAGILFLGASIAFSCTYKRPTSLCERAQMSLQKSPISVQKSPTSNDGHRHATHGCVDCLLLCVQTTSRSSPKSPIFLKRFESGPLALSS